MISIYDVKISLYDVTMTPIKSLSVLGVSEVRRIISEACLKNMEFLSPGMCKSFYVEDTGQQNQNFTMGHRERSHIWNDDGGSVKIPVSST